jgi:hypothetical protein
MVEELAARKAAGSRHVCPHLLGLELHQDQRRPFPHPVREHGAGLLDAPHLYKLDRMGMPGHRGARPRLALLSQAQGLCFQ